MDIQHKMQSIPLGALHFRSVTISELSNAHLFPFNDAADKMHGRSTSISFLFSAKSHLRVTILDNI